MAGIKGGDKGGSIEDTTAEARGEDKECGIEGTMA